MKAFPDENAGGGRTGTMADPYSFTLLVELGENDIPKLKNKLVKYFQSKKSSGGDCEMDHESGSSSAVVRFRREEGESAPAGLYFIH